MEFGRCAVLLEFGFPVGLGEGREGAGYGLPFGYAEAVGLLEVMSGEHVAYDKHKSGSVTLTRLTV